ncbi:MAG TPA: chemotaxis protein CheX [Terracidiphilus sp.]|nr:chemotaxis protein CheX [Terracidiphilus sp.]
MLLSDVRSAVIASGQARRSGRGGSECREGKEERVMAVSLRESVAQVADPKNLDESVEEVFELMMGVKCHRATAEMPANHDESVTAVVGFGGLLSGACVFKLASETALQVAARMTGIEFAEADDTVKDAIGEVCNMLAGSWKGKVPELAANCGLSVPAVITGRDYKLHVQAPEFQLHHVYAFGDDTFAVTIVCDGLQ